MFCFFAGSCTFYKSYLFLLTANGNAHDLTNFFGNRGTTNRTAIYFSFSFYDCCCKSGTSGIATATTVVARKDTENSFFSFIHFYCEFLPCDSKKNSDEQTGSTDNDCR